MACSVSDPLSRQLHSAIEGAKAASLSVKILIHLANGWGASGLDSFFSRVFMPRSLDVGQVDIVGASSDYPFYANRVVVT